MTAWGEQFGPCGRADSCVLSARCTMFARCSVIGRGDQLETLETEADQDRPLTARGWMAGIRRAMRPHGPPRL